VDLLRGVDPQQYVCKYIFMDVHSSPENNNFSFSLGDECN
jgi:hypothetical protein